MMACTMKLPVPGSMYKCIINNILYIYVLTKIMHKFTYLILFITTILSRLLFKYFSGYDNFQLFGDSVRYDILSDRIIDGCHDLDFTAFIISPLYPYTLALIKLIFTSYWQDWAVGFQFIMVSVSVVFLAKLSYLLFENKNVSILSGIIYMLYPMTMFYNYTLSQETTFQSYFIICIFYLVKYLKFEKTKSLIVSAIFYSLSFLTKSHILLFAPFIVLLILSVKNGKNSTGLNFKKVFIYGLVCFLLTLPDGIKNYNLHGVYTFSGTGAKTFFHNGNSQENYNFVFYNVGLNDDQELAYIFDCSYVYPKYGKVNALPHKQKQDIHLQMAIKWIKENPIDFIYLKLYSFGRFFTPGISKNKYNSNIWLLSLMSSSPIFIFAYLGLYRILKTDYYKHLYVFYLITVMFIFYMVFMPQTRFRVITLEPFYIIYASYFIANGLKWLSNDNHFAKTLIKIRVYFRLQTIKSFITNI